MLDLNDVQTTLLAYLKNNSAIDITLTANGVSDKEIRQNFWMGNDFSYPNVRIACDLTPSQNGCDGPDTVSIYIVVSSEQKSSKQSMVIAGVIAKQLHNSEFSNNGVRFTAVRVLQLPRPTATEVGTWQSEIQATAKATMV